MSKSKLKALLVLVVFLARAAPEAPAQSSVVFVPSTDVQREGSTSLDAEIYTHLGSFNSGAFQTIGSSVVHGLKGNLEIGANVYITRDRHSKSAELQPNIKWGAFRSKDGKVAIAVGAVGFVTLNSEAASNLSGMLYANASRRFRYFNGLRLTGGVYRIADGASEDVGPDTVGALLAVEQPITKRLTMLADWASGENRLGYGNAGISYELPKSQYLTVAYSVGNSGRGNNFLSAFYTFSF